MTVHLEATEVEVRSATSQSPPSAGVRPATELATQAWKALSVHAVQHLHPAYFAMVMATGIVAIAAWMATFAGLVWTTKDLAAAEKGAVP